MREMRRVHRPARALGLGAFARPHVLDERGAPPMRQSDERTRIPGGAGAADSADAPASALASGRGWPVALELARLVNVLRNAPDLDE